MTYNKFYQGKCFKKLSHSEKYAKLTSNSKLIFDLF